MKTRPAPPRRRVRRFPGVRRPRRRRDGRLLPRSGLQANAAKAADTSSSDGPIAADERHHRPRPHTVLDDHAYSTRSRFYPRAAFSSTWPSASTSASISACPTPSTGSSATRRTSACAPERPGEVALRGRPGPAVHGRRLRRPGRPLQLGIQRFNQRQRTSTAVVGTSGTGHPRLPDPSLFNIFDFNSNRRLRLPPLTLNIRDKAELLVEWDNIANWSDSRFNAGLRFFPHSRISTSTSPQARHRRRRRIYSDGAPKGPERIVQLKYEQQLVYLEEPRHGQAHRDPDGRRRLVRD